MQRGHVRELEDAIDNPDAEPVMPCEAAKPAIVVYGIHLDYSFLEEVANHFANGDENSQQSDDEIVLAALDGTADEKLTGLALRLVLSDHIGIPHETQPDLLTEAEQVFAPKKPKAVKAKAEGSNKSKATAAKATAKKEPTRKRAA